MDCSDATPLLHPLLDGEMDADRTEAVSRHLAECPECRAKFEEQAGWRRAVGDAAQRYPAPPTLRGRISAALAEEETPPRDAPAAPQRRSLQRPRLQRPWLQRPWALAASLALAIVTSSGLTAYVTGGGGRQDPLIEEIVGSHVRSLMAEHLMDVASTDQHTVKPWFHGRIDLAPPVEDLASEGFPLIGGRLDYLDHQPVAALVYRHRQHPINLFALPASGGTDTAPESLAIRGYTILHWRQEGIGLWAISDLPPNEMAQFRDLLEKNAPPPMP